MIVFCGIIFISVLLFFYLLNTARKKTPSPNAGKKDFTPVYVSIADKPDAILQGMGNFMAEVEKTEAAGDKWRWVPMLIFFTGLGLAAIDGILFLFGYFSMIFSIGALALWLAAFILARSLRKSDSHDFSPRYFGMKTLLRTLRDDLKPGSTFLGHLDLTGPMLQTKVARETKDTRDRITQHFADNWLSLKAKLYDGNVLRVAAVQKNQEAQELLQTQRHQRQDEIETRKVQRLRTGVEGAHRRQPAGV